MLFIWAPMDITVALKVSTSKAAKKISGPRNLNTFFQKNWYTLPASSISSDWQKSGWVKKSGRANVKFWKLFSGDISRVLASNDTDTRSIDPKHCRYWLKRLSFQNRENRFSFVADLALFSLVNQKMIYVNVDEQSWRKCMYVVCTISIYFNLDREQCRISSRLQSTVKTFTSFAIPVTWSNRRRIASSDANASNLFNVSILAGRNLIASTLAVNDWHAFLLTKPQQSSSL